MFECSANRCPPVPQLSNAQADSSLALLGTEITYTCDVGYLFPAGSDAVAVCDGTNWSTVNVNCEGSQLTVIIVETFKMCFSVLVLLHF